MNSKQRLLVYPFVLLSLTSIAFALLEDQLQQCDTKGASAIAMGSFGFEAGLFEAEMRPAPLDGINGIFGVYFQKSTSNTDESIG